MHVTVQKCVRASHPKISQFYFKMNFTPVLKMILLLMIIRKTQLPVTHGQGIFYIFRGVYLLSNHGKRCGTDFS